MASGGGPRSLLQGFSSGQRSTATPSSKKRISERIVEQIVDPVSFMVLSQDQVHLLLTLQLVLKNAVMSLVKGFFALFSILKKVRSWLRTRGRALLPESSPSPPAAQLEVSVEWVRLRERHAGKTYFWNRRTNCTVWQAPAGLEVVWYGERDEEGGIWYWHRDTRVSAFDFLPLPPG